MINVALVFLIMSIFLSLKRKLQLLATAAITGIIALTFAVTTGTLSSIAQRFVSSKSLDWRFGMWRTLYHLILQRNYIIGEGANASRIFLQHIMGAESYAPHNVYLETTYNYGIIGLIPLLLIFAFLLIQGISICKYRQMLKTIKTEWLA